MAFPRLAKKAMQDTLRALKKCAWNQAHAAVEMGVSRSTLSARVRVMRQKGMVVPNFAVEVRHDTRRNYVSQPQQEAKELRKENEHLRGKVARMHAAQAKLPPVKKLVKRSGKDDVLRVIFPDLHGVYQDPAAVAAFMADVQKLSPHEVIGLGDLTDCGGFLAQHHVWGYVAETEYTFEDDIVMSNQFLDSLQAAAPGASLELIEGNHDHRVEQWCVTSALRSKRDSAFLLQHYSPKVLLNLKGRGARYFSRGEMHDGLPVQGAIKRGKCVFTHEAKLQTVHRWGLNVVHGHDHRPSMRLINTVANGTIGIWSLGCLSKRQPLWQHGNPTEWAHSYGIQVVARSGRFLHLTVPIVDGHSLLPTLKLG